MRREHVQVLEAVRSGARTSIRIAHRADVHWRTTRVILTKLKRAGLVRREGNTSGAEWFPVWRPAWVSDAGELRSCA